MSFLLDTERITPAPWEQVALRMGRDLLSLAEVAALVAPKAGEHLEAMAQAAHALTLQRFGRTVKLYAPVYVSNACVNACRYCGFRHENAIARRTLSTQEAIAEAAAIMRAGHRHLLLVSGEDPRACPLELIEAIARELRPRVAGLAVEIWPQDEEGYRRLAAAGVDGVTLYQETYDEGTYATMHPSGPKRRFGSRLDAIDAAGRAGMRFLGIGALLGLADWRRETVCLIAHARWLMKRHWRSAIAVSVPRLRDCAAGFAMPHPVADAELAQMICALRLSLPDCGIALSTREPASLREWLLPLGVTQMSAGSVTRPGGYASPAEAGEQFHLEDARSPAAVARMLSERGYDPVWKDWDAHLSG